MSGSGATSVDPSDGKVLWERPWPPNTRIVQPAQIANGDLRVSAGAGNGLRRIAAAQGPGGWRVTERWTSFRLKPYFNDFVVHEGRAYGFDGSILACIDVENGERLWQGGRYGQGQLLLLADQDLLFLLTEHGGLALVRASADGFEEVARAPPIDRKTWNHPALVEDVLLVRNGEEMAAFRLRLAGG